jgi:hypothetical protein
MNDVIDAEIDPPVKPEDDAGQEAAPSNIPALHFRCMSFEARFARTSG